MKVTNKVVRVPLRTTAEQAKPDLPSMSPSGELVGQALDMLSAVADRVAELRQALQEKPPDRLATVALFGAALAAHANLSVENLESLTTAIRTGRLPRRRAAR